MVNIKTHLNTIIFIFFGIVCFGQVDQEYIYTSDRNLGISDLIIDGGELLISGYYFEDIDSRDLFVMRSDLEGNVSESISIGSVKREGIVKGGFFKDPTGRLSIFGNTTFMNDSPVIDDPFFIRLNSDLTLDDNQSWGTQSIDDQFSFVIQTSDGGVLAVGLFGWATKGGMIVKFDSDYNIEWSKKYTTTNAYLFFGSAIEMPDGTYFCTAVNQIDSEKSDFILVHLDANGEVITQTQYLFGTSNPKPGSEFIVLHNNRVEVICGISNETSRIGLLKLELDYSGNILETSTVYSDFDFAVSNYVQTSNNEFIFSGFILTDTFREGLILKWDGESVVEGFSKKEPSLNISVGNILDYCQGTECRYLIGVNKSDIEKNGYFSIVNSALDCPDIDGDLFQVEPIGYVAQSFTPISEHAIGSTSSFIVNDEFISEVERIEKNLEIELGNDTILCANTEIVLDATSASANFYEWSTGETSPKIFVENPGLYSVTISDGCQDFIDNIQIEALDLPQIEIYTPNIFSPNSDGINDCFMLTPSDQIESATLTIFNRWGNKVFHSSDAEICWDGRINGKLAVSDVYVFNYTINYVDCAGILQQKSGAGNVLLN